MLSNLKIFLKLKHLQRRKRHKSQIKQENEVTIVGNSKLNSGDILQKAVLECGITNNTEPTIRNSDSCFSAKLHEKINSLKNSYRPETNSLNNDISILDDFLCKTKHFVPSTIDSSAGTFISTRFNTSSESFSSKIVDNALSTEASNQSINSLLTKTSKISDNVSFQIPNSPNITNNCADLNEKSTLEKCNEIGTSSPKNIKKITSSNRKGKNENKDELNTNLVLRNCNYLFYDNDVKDCLVSLIDNVVQRLGSDSSKINDNIKNCKPNVIRNPVCKHETANSKNFIKPTSVSALQQNNYKIPTNSYSIPNLILKREAVELDLNKSSKIKDSEKITSKKLLNNYLEKDSFFQSKKGKMQAKVVPAPKRKKLSLKNCPDKPRRRLINSSVDKKLIHWVVRLMSKQGHFDDLSNVFERGTSMKKVANFICMLEPNLLSENEPVSKFTENVRKPIDSSNIKDDEPLLSISNDCRLHNEINSSKMIKTKGIDSKKVELQNFAKNSCSPAYYPKVRLYLEKKLIKIMENDASFSESEQCNMILKLIEGTNNTCRYFNLNAQNKSIKSSRVPKLKLKQKSVEKSLSSKSRVKNTELGTEGNSLASSTERGEKPELLLECPKKLKSNCLTSKRNRLIKAVKELKIQKSKSNTYTFKNNSKTTTGKMKKTSFKKSTRKRHMSENDSLSKMRFCDRAVQTEPDMDYIQWLNSRKKDNKKSLNDDNSFESCSNVVNSNRSKSIILVEENNDRFQSLPNSAEISEESLEFARDNLQNNISCKPVLKKLKIVKSSENSYYVSKPKSYQQENSILNKLNSYSTSILNESNEKDTDMLVKTSKEKNRTRKNKNTVNRKELQYKVFANNLAQNFSDNTNSISKIKHTTEEKTNKLSKKDSSDKYNKLKFHKTKNTSPSKGNILHKTLESFVQEDINEAKTVIEEKPDNDFQISFNSKEHICKDIFQTESNSNHLHSKNSSLSLESGEIPLESLAVNKVDKYVYEASCSTLNVKQPADNLNKNESLNIHKVRRNCVNNNKVILLKKVLWKPDFEKAFYVALQLKAKADLEKSVLEKQKQLSGGSSGNMLSGDNPYFDGSFEHSAQSNNYTHESLNPHSNYRVQLLMCRNQADLDFKSQTPRTGK